MGKNGGKKSGQGGGQSGKAQGARTGEGGVMANVTERIDKLVAGGQITRKVADEALEFFRRRIFAGNGTGECQRRGAATAVYANVAAIPQ